jgi:hypothetical protein
VMSELKKNPLSAVFVFSKENIKNFNLKNSYSFDFLSKNATNSLIVPVFEAI